MIRKGLGSRRGSTPAVKGATEEERLGLVKGDTNTGRNPTTLSPYDDEDEEDIEWMEDKARQIPGPKRDLTPPRRDGKEKEKELETSEEEEYYEQQRQKWDGKGSKPPYDDGTSGGGGGGMFI
jgi:hypothetical protein